MPFSQVSLRGPIAPYVAPIVEQLRSADFCVSTLSVFTRTARCFDEWLRRRGIQVDQIDECVVHEHCRYRERLRLQSHGADAALRRILLLLRERGHCAPRKELPRSPTDKFLAELAEHLATHRGLAPSTIRVRIQVARRFLSVHPLHEAKAATRPIGEAVSTFLQREVGSRGPQTAKCLAAGLRALLRYLAFRGTIDPTVIQCVPAIAHWRMASLPRQLSRAQVRQLLSIPDRTSALGRRDYAILLLLIRLGLRANEIVCMTLSDIDWRGRSLAVRGKGGSRSQLPLSPELCAAIADYLRRDRPRSMSRRVFLTSFAPYRGFLDGTSVSAIVRRALGQIGVSGSRCGAHVLRHTLATDLLQRGVSLTSIGQILRHQHPDTTRIYSKIDDKALRRRALAWPGLAP